MSESRILAYMFVNYGVLAELLDNRLRLVMRMGCNENHGEIVGMVVLIVGR